MNQLRSLCSDRRCRICDGYLCSYNKGPICWRHVPGNGGVLIEVGPGEWRRFHVAAETAPADKQRADDFADLMMEPA